MKFIVSASVTFLMFLNSASADSRCGGQRGSPCQQFYGRLEAFKKLVSAENSQGDAEGNYTLVADIAKRFNLNLQYATDNFVYLQQAVGGSSATTEARESFKMAINEVNQFNQLHQVVDAFVDLIHAENSISDAQGDFSVVVAGGRQKQVSLGVLAYSFIDILRAEGGSEMTAEARSAFKMVISADTKFHPSEATRNYVRIRSLENGISDSMSDFRLILEAARICNSIEKATDDFVEVLSQVGGSSKTTEAQSLFRKLYGI